MIRQNRVDVVQLFVDNAHLIGLDLTASDEYGMTPLELAKTFQLKRLTRLFDSAT